MPPNPTFEALVDRLLEVTLQVEQAVHREAFEELTNLFFVRETILNQIQSTGKAHQHPRLLQIEEIDSRIESTMKFKLEEIREAMRMSEVGLRAHRTYSRAS